MKIHSNFSVVGKIFLNCQTVCVNVQNVPKKWKQKKNRTEECNNWYIKSDEVIGLKENGNEMKRNRTDTKSLILISIEEKKQRQEVSSEKNPKEK